MYVLQRQHTIPVKLVRDESCNSTPCAVRSTCYAPSLRSFWYANYIISHCSITNLIFPRLHDPLNMQQPDSTKYLITRHNGTDSSRGSLWPSREVARQPSLRRACYGFPTTVSSSPFLVVVNVGTRIPRNEIPSGYDLLDVWDSGVRMN
jgi:hypothetical protein